MLRIAHFSDLHFSHLSWNPKQFLSKQWLGNLNLFLHRKHQFTPERLVNLISLLQKRHVNTLLITGDLSSTSEEAEFKKAQQFIREFEAAGMAVFVLPGNHDHYTKSACQSKRFYQFFPSSYSSHPSNLVTDRMTVTALSHGIWLVALDTALATALHLSTGCFSQALEEKLEKILQEIPSSDTVILMNHFPLFSNESPRKKLVREEALRTLLARFTQVKLYLHGHSHRHSVADLRNNQLPIIVDCGSSAYASRSTWNLIDIDTTGCTIEAFQSSAPSVWQPFLKSTFSWQAS